jgi:hypothetical protein
MLSPPQCVGRTINGEDDLQAAHLAVLRGYFTHDLRLRVLLRQIQRFASSTSGLLQSVDGGTGHVVTVNADTSSDKVLGQLGIRDSVNRND